MFHHAMREEYLKPTPLKPYMTYADHLVWPIHVPRRCEPLITPHLSLRGNSRTRATFPTHKKSHNPHPQGERGKGFNMGTLHCGGVGGVPAKPGSYIYIYVYTHNMHIYIYIYIHIFTMTIYTVYVIEAINLKQSLKGEQIPVASIRYYSIW